MIEIWIAEFENGSMIFDSEPSRSDIRNACLPDAEGDINVYQLSCIETERSHFFTVEEDK